MAELQVDLVSVDRRVWQGEASMVIARTTEGEIGILPGHAPVLGVLVDGSTVEIRQSAGESLMVAIDGGFLSVDDSGVRILAERAELGSEVDVAGARADLRPGRRPRRRRECGLRRGGRRPGCAPPASRPVVPARAGGGRGGDRRRARRCDRARAACWCWGSSPGARLLRRSGATLDLCLRYPGTTATGWALGVAKLGDDRLLWYRVFSFAPRPKVSMPRFGFEVRERRRPAHAEGLSLMAGRGRRRRRDRGTAGRAGHRRAGAAGAAGLGSSRRRRARRCPTRSDRLVPVLTDLFRPLAASCGLPGPCYRDRGCSCSIRRTSRRPRI